MSWQTTHLGQPLSLVHWDGAVAGPKGSFFDRRKPPQALLFSLWDDLKRSNAICTWSLTNASDIFSFADKCILFATILYGFEATSDEGDTQCESDAKGKEKEEVTIGCVYMAETARPQEATIGIVLAPDHTGQGIGPVVLEMIISTAMETFKFHRLTAVVMDVPESGRAVSVFKRLGFTHEGTHRLAAYSPLVGEWQDEIHLALVDIDWVFRNRGPQSNSKDLRWKKKTPWEQMLERHEREMEDMLQRTGRIKKSHSTETLRLIPESDTDVKVEEDNDMDFCNASSSPTESEVEDPPYTSYEHEQMSPEFGGRGITDIGDLHHGLMQAQDDIAGFEREWSEESSVGEGSGWELTDGGSSLNDDEEFLIERAQGF